MNQVCLYLPNTGEVRLEKQLLVFEAIWLKQSGQKLTESSIIKRVLELNQGSIDLYLLYAELLADRGGAKTAIKVIESIYSQINSG